MSPTLRLTNTQGHAFYPVNDRVKFMLRLINEYKLHIKLDYIKLVFIKSSLLINTVYITVNQIKLN